MGLAMALLPIFVEVGDRPVLVVGGGAVALRKVEGLRKAGASVTVISPRLTARLKKLADQGALRHIERRYRPGDMGGFSLIYAATDDAALERKLFAEAQRLGLMINVAGQPELCSFIVPASIRRGDLLVAISTAGASPALARRLRQQLELALGPEYEALVDLMGRARRRLRESLCDGRSRMRRLNALADSEIGECLRRHDLERVDRLLAEHLGEGFDLAALGFSAERLDALFGPRLQGADRPAECGVGAADDRA
jgi:precorrin-2 dehydrogenase/sirohydrochlorin ferrochelatase